MELTFKQAFPDVCPEKLESITAGKVIAGSFTPYGSVAEYYFHKQRDVPQIKIDDKVYFIADTKSNAVKIGVAKDVNLRLKSLQCANPNELTLLKVINGGYKKEKELHERFKNEQIRNEWYNLNIINLI
jgi:hypothetical protein